MVVDTPVEPASSAQSWGDVPAKIAFKAKPSKTGQETTDIEVFDSNDGTTTSAPKQNINIEIHNVFSFGTNTSIPSRNENRDSKISPQTEQSH